MSSDQTANLVYSLLLLVLVGSSLIARRLPLGQTLRHALAWVAIFAGAIVLFSFRHQMGEAWQQVKRELNPGAPVQSGESVRILRGEDGHFSVDARVNGHAVRFLIDSGATTSTMARADAAAAGVNVNAPGFDVVVETANGMANMRRARIAKLEVGNIVQSDVPILVSKDVEELNLLGMSFLSSLKTWRVEGREMILTP